jgi:hypothetical protein
MWYRADGLDLIRANDIIYPLAPGSAVMVSAYECSSIGHIISYGRDLDGNYKVLWNGEEIHCLPDEIVPMADLEALPEAVPARDLR